MVGTRAECLVLIVYVYQLLPVHQTKLERRLRTWSFGLVGPRYSGLDPACLVSIVVLRRVNME
jgi:hypothetical protein